MWRRVLGTMTMVMVAGFGWGGGHAFAEAPEPARLIVDANPGFREHTSSYPREFTSAGNLLFFAARTQPTDGHGDADFSLFMPSNGELWASDGTEAGTRLVKDVRPGVQPSAIRRATEWLGNLYFEATQADRRPGLWRSDGTEQGTVLLRAFEKMGWFDSFVAFGDALYFAADDGVRGMELWRTDGTVEGTVLVKDIFPGIGDYDIPHSSHPGELTVVADTLYFSARDGEHGREVWKSDGTEAGTVLVADPIGGVDSRGEPLGIDGRSFVESPHGVVFAGWDPAHGTELWRTDGTEAGTVRLTDLNPGANNSVRVGPVVVGDSLLLLIDDGVHGAELWKTDGTEGGTVLVKDVNPGPGEMSSRGHDPEWVAIVVEDVLYFVGDDGVHGRELWRTDGSPDGTFLVVDTLPGPGYSRPRNFVEVNGRIYFITWEQFPATEMWSTDGTPGGSSRVFSADDQNRPISPEFLTEHLGVLYFNASGPKGREPWRSDGTPEGTWVLKDVSILPKSLAPQSMTPFDGKLFFAGYSEEEGGELWTTDGSAEGTSLFKDLVPGLAPWNYPNDSTPREFVEFAGALYFLATGEDQTTGLWQTDGTPEGTVVVWNEHDIYSDWRSRAPMTVAGGRLYFVATDDDHGSELWRSDGTAAGTELVRDLLPGPASSFGHLSSNPVELTAMGERVYFAADDGVHGRELWVSDGTEAGTELLKDVDSGFKGDTPIGSYPRSLVDVDGTLYFGANDGELWKSDGSTAGTVFIKQVSTYFGRHDFPDFLTNLNGTLIFSAFNEHGHELWRSDGTAAGTEVLIDLMPERGSSYPHSLRVIDGLLLFVANDGVRGEEVWLTDGTAEGTRILADVEPGPGGSQGTLFPAANWYISASFAVLGNEVVFSVIHSEQGGELWAVPRAALVDADLDGLEDADERALGTDLWNPDSDGDGLSDGFEVHELGSDPLAKDTDGDGFDDALEAEAGSDPTNADDVPVALARTGQRCVNGMNRGAADLTRVRSRQLEGCVRDFGDGRSGSALVCFDLDPRRQFGRAATRLASTEHRLCRYLEPAFGHVPAGEIAIAAAETPSALLEDLLGTNADGALVQDDVDASSCQQDVLAGAQRLHAALWHETRVAKSQVLRGRFARRRIDPPVAASELGSLLEGWLSIDPRGRLAKRSHDLSERVASSCGDGLDLSTLFPGACAESETFAACLTAATSCRFCQQLNATDALAIDCDGFDDGVGGNESCVLPAP